MTNSTNLPPTPNETLTLPGTLLCLYNVGVLITGPSGIGKSECALMLIDRGHKLISDDVTEFFHQQEDLWGRAPELLRDLLEVRDVGIINVRHCRGNQALLSQQKVNLIIALSDKARPPNQDRLSPNTSQTTLFGHTLPTLTLHHTQTRPLDILVETIVKNWIMSQSGHDAHNQLIQHHHQTLEAKLL